MISHLQACLQELYISGSRYLLECASLQRTVYQPT